MQHKKVELVELFFDLVMVYAVSKTTGIIHHLNEEGIIAPFDFFSFLVAFVIIINAWTYQAVFTNHYGSNSPRDMTFSFIGMGLLLFLSNTITSDWETAFFPFTMCLGLVFVVQFVQYLVTYLSVKTPEDRFMIRGFLLVTGIYACTLLVGAQLPYQVGIWFSLGGLAINLLLPVLFYLGVFATRGYNAPRFAAPPRLMAVQVIVFVAAFALSLACVNVHEAIILIAAVVTMLLAVILYRHYWTHRAE